MRTSDQLRVRGASGRKTALPGFRRRQAGFTLAETLAALMFMAIVIPVAVEGLRIANLAGQVAERKASAARVADRLLNELIVTGEWKQASPGGTVREGTREYRWQLRNESWDQDALRVVTLEVTFAVQGRDYDVRLSTLVDDATQITATTATGGSAR